MKINIDFLSRLALSFLFVLSAIAKLYPSPSIGLENFEMEQLYPMGFSEYGAAIFSRFMLTCEFALGIVLLFPFYLKRIVLPLAGILLFLFIGHLSYETISAGNHGNCGCFGELIPMTPIQAILKNIFALGLIAVSFRFTTKTDKVSWLYFPAVFFGFFTGLLLVSPIEETSPLKAPVYTKYNVLVDTLTKKKETGEVFKEINFGLDADFNGKLSNLERISPLLIPISVISTRLEGAIKVKLKNDDHVKDQLSETKIPESIISAYSEYYPGIDNGKKLLCIFNPTCDHCMKICKEIHNSNLEELKNIEICILFKEDKPSNIEKFFTKTGITYPYHTIPKSAFIQWLSAQKFTQPPGIVYLWNGHEKGRYQYKKDGVELDLKSLLSN